MERRLPWAAFGLVLAPVFLVAAAAEDHAVGLYVSVLFTFLAVLVTGVSARAYHESAILGPSPKAAKAAAKENVSRPLSPSRRKPVDSLLDDTSGRSLSSLAWGGYGRPRQHRHGAWRDTATGEGEYGAHDVPETVSSSGNPCWKLSLLLPKCSRVGESAANCVPFFSLPPARAPRPRRPVPTQQGPAGLY